MSRFLSVCTGLILCTHALHVKADSHFETRDETKQFLSKPIDHLSETQMDIFMLGKSFFHIPWVEAPSATTARDGLGPLFSANTCTSCHPHNGAGSVYTKEGDISRSFVTRFALKGQKDARLGFVPDPIYGAQLSINGVKDVPYEGKPTLKYQEITEYYWDGTKVFLYKPIIGVEDLKYGALSEHTGIANRIAPALVGMGLIDQIRDEDILAYEDRDDANKDGISGKANWVFDPQSHTQKLGKFNWKASATSVMHQSASALSNDMSITNPLFPNETCTQSQKECLDAPKGRDEFDAPMERVAAIASYLSQLKIPKSIPSQTFAKGEKVFEELGCAKCHVASFNLKDGSKIAPYSDFLVHDMGEGLADDGRSEFDAQPSEWRTQPLWSLGKRIKILEQRNFLHDGRARSVEEAILWHDGEAKVAKERFKSLTKEQRAQLLEFIEEL